MLGASGYYMSVAHYDFAYITVMFACQVYDEGQMHSAVTAVPVNIIDDNDNAPVFMKSSYQVSF